MGYLRLPKLVKIGHASWRIQVKTLDEKFGETSQNLSRIRLTKGMSSSTLRETAMHELLHAVLCEASANEILGWSEDDQEKAVRLLSPWLLGLLRDNAELVGFFTGGDEVH